MKRMQTAWKVDGYNMIIVICGSNIVRIFDSCAIGARKCVN
jgi:hypothetical protein